MLKVGIKSAQLFGKKVARFFSFCISISYKLDNEKDYKD